LRIEMEHFVRVGIECVRLRFPRMLRPMRHDLRIEITPKFPSSRRDARTIPSAAARPGPYPGEKGIAPQFGQRSGARQDRVAVESVNHSMRDVIGVGALALVLTLAF